MSNDNHSNKAGLMLLQSTRIFFSIHLYYSLWDPPAIRQFQFPHPQHSFDNIYLHQDRLLHLQCCPSAQVHELLRSHCGDNREGTLFLWLHIYYAHPAFVRFEYSVCRGSLMITYIHLRPDDGFSQYNLNNVLQVYIEHFDLNHFLIVKKRTFSLSKSSLFYPSFSLFINLS